MKKMKKMMALVIAMVMVLSMSIPAMAEVAAKTIKVNGLEEGDNVKYYKVIEWKSDGSGWAFVAPFAGLLSEAQQKEIIGYVETNAETGAKTGKENGCGSRAAARAAHSAFPARAAEGSAAEAPARTAADPAAAAGRIHGKSRAGRRAAEIRHE